VVSTRVSGSVGTGLNLALYPKFFTRVCVLAISASQLRQARPSLCPY